jgi:hypothetical protein
MLSQDSKFKYDEDSPNSVEKLKEHIEKLELIGI